MKTESDIIRNPVVDKVISEYANIADREQLNGMELLHLSNYLQVLAFRTLMRRSINDLV